MAAQLENLDWSICGRGFVFNTENIEQDRHRITSYNVCYTKLLRVHFGDGTDTVWDP